MKPQPEFQKRLWLFLGLALLACGLGFWIGSDDEDVVIFAKEDSPKAEIKTPAHPPRKPTSETNYGENSPPSAQKPLIDAEMKKQLLATQSVFGKNKMPAKTNDEDSKTDDNSEPSADE